MTPEIFCGTVLFLGYTYGGIMPWKKQKKLLFF